MLRSRDGRILVAVLAVALLVIAIAVAMAVNDGSTEVAQAPPPPGAPPPGGPMHTGPMGPQMGMGQGMGPGMMGQGMGPGMMGPGMMGMMPSMPAVAVIGKCLYVVQGNMIYKYDENLNLLKQCELPKPEPKKPGDGPGMPPMGTPGQPGAPSM